MTQVRDRAGVVGNPPTNRDYKALDVDLPDPTVFIVSWVDYCNKYGMGYILTDGTVGVHFNDSTSMVVAPDKLYVHTPSGACLILIQLL